MWEDDFRPYRSGVVQLPPGMRPVQETSASGHPKGAAICRIAAGLRMAIP